MNNNKPTIRDNKTIKNNLKTIKRDKVLYIFVGLLITSYILWHYLPLYGLLIAFKDYEAIKGVWGSEFVGGAHFQNLIFGNFSELFWRAFRNTFVISIYGLIFGFPIPILIAIFFNEIGSKIYRKITQTIMYLPHFISEVTIIGLVTFMLYKSSTSTGFLAQILYSLKIVPEGIKVLDSPQYFKPLYIITGIWKETGYSSIVYFSAIISISPTLYEAIKIDGGNKIQELRYVTLPHLSSLITIMLIMRIGRLLNVGYERVILLYNRYTYETADIINSFVHRVGLLQGNHSLGTAASMFNSVIGFALVIGANTIARKISKNSLW